MKKFMLNEPLLCICIDWSRDFIQIWWQKSAEKWKVPFTHITNSPETWQLNTKHTYTHTHMHNDGLNLFLVNRKQKGNSFYFGFSRFEHGLTFNAQITYQNRNAVNSAIAQWDIIKQHLIRFRYFIAEPISIELFVYSSRVRIAIFTDERSIRHNVCFIVIVYVCMYVCMREK